MPTSPLEDTPEARLGQTVRARAVPRRSWRRAQRTGSARFIASPLVRCASAMRSASVATRGHAGRVTRRTFPPGVSMIHRSLRIGVPRATLAATVALGTIIAWLMPAALGFDHPVHAATLSVNALGDDLSQGPNGNCTLREAILAANTDSPVDGCIAGDGADTIELGPGQFQLSIAGREENAGNTGDLDITSDLTLQGSGAGFTVIHGGDIDRVLHVAGAATVSVADLTIQHGFTTGPNGTPGGAGILNDGGHVTLLRSAIYQCTAGSLADDGSAIDNRGTGVVEIVESQLADNLASGSAAIWNHGTEIRIRDSEIRNNSTPSSTGVSGIWNAAGSALRIERSLLTHNRARVLYVNGGTVDILDTTIGSDFPLVASNDVVSIINGTVTLTHVTMQVEPFGLTNSHGVLRIGDSIVDSTILCATSFVATSLGGNLVTDTRCLNPGTPFSDPTDRVAPPRLAAMGPEGTFRPRPGSPAIDSAVDANCSATDQRGVTRPQDGDLDGAAHCDRGAHELDCGSDDPDGDGFPGPCDVCPEVSDAGQQDGDADGVGDACDDCPLAYDPNQYQGTDGDGVAYACDNCPSAANADQLDRDHDGIGDVCDYCTDADADGYGDPAGTLCAHAEPDCDDTRSAVNPGAIEVPGNGLDDDCNAATPDCTDADGDGYAVEVASCGPADCDDTNPAVHPGATEIPRNGIDDDCDPATPQPGCGPVPQEAEAATGRGARAPATSGAGAFAVATLALYALSRGARFATGVARRRSAR